MMATCTNGQGRFASAPKPEVVTWYTPALTGGNACRTNRGRVSDQAVRCSPSGRARRIGWVRQGQRNDCDSESRPSQRSGPGQQSANVRSAHRQAQQRRQVLRCSQGAERYEVVCGSNTQAEASVQAQGGAPRDCTDDLQRCIGRPTCSLVGCQLGCDRSVRVRWQLGVELWQRLLRRSAVRSRYVAEQRWWGLRSVRSSGDPRAANRDRRECAARTGQPGRLADLRETRVVIDAHQRVR